MDIRVEYSAGSCIFLALLCLILPADWLFAAVFAAVFHELCHVLAVTAVGGRILALKIGTAGAVMDTDSMSQWKELVCILAGPAGSLLLFLFREWIPRTAVCGLVQGIYNLAPVFPLDGGRILSCLLGMVYAPDMAEKIGFCVQCIFWAVVLALGIWLSFGMRQGMMPMTAAMLVLSITLFRKFSCKEGKQRVQ